MKRINQVMTYIWDLWTATQIKLAVFFAVAWSAISFALGGIDASITALAVIVVLDFATGVAAGCLTGSFESSVGIKGIIKKVAMFAVVGFMFLLDTAMSTTMLRTMTIAGFATIEAMSIIENIDRMGYGEYIPPFIRNCLARIKQEKGV